MADGRAALRGDQRRIDDDAAFAVLFWLVVPHHRACPARYIEGADDVGVRQPREVGSVGRPVRKTALDLGGVDVDVDDPETITAKPRPEVTPARRTDFLVMSIVDVSLHTVDECRLTRNRLYCTASGSRPMYPRM
jgi:hypothetical protein